MAGKKISQLTSSLSPSLSGVMPIVLSGTTYSTTLNSLRQVLVDSGSHNFTGSQHISGSLTVNGSITAREYILSSSVTNMVIESVSGSSSFGNSIDDNHKFTGSMFISNSLSVNGNINTTNVNVSNQGHVKYLSVGNFGFPHPNNPEVLRTESSGSYNIAHFSGNHQNYTQINLQNINSGSNASSDVVITADNGTEGLHFVNLGINSSTYQGGFVGVENDAYLLNVGKDLYVGTVGGINHPSNLNLFSQNSWENPQIHVSGSGQVGFNTLNVTEGYQYEFSGSINVPNNLNIGGFVILSEVSSSLNFANDIEAQQGNVPLGGLYRSGSHILIRLT